LRQPRNLNIYNHDWMPYAETAGFDKTQIKIEGKYD